MRHYECECKVCGHKKQFAFHNEPYPEYGELFVSRCRNCEENTQHTRVLTKKTVTELRHQEKEQFLRKSIAERCQEYGFSVRFLYQSVIITTALTDWCFDYHQDRITLYHESTCKINFETGDYAKAHVQFSGRKIKPLEVVDYIASHDTWRAEHKQKR